MKKLLSLLLALIMVLSLFAGCGKTEEPVKTEEPTKTEEPAKTEEKKEEAKQEEEASSSWKEEHPTWLCEEKQTLTVFSTEGVSTYLPMSNDLYFWQWMEEYTNVHIEWELAPNEEYVTVVSAKLASGEELPDIMNFSKTAVAQDAAANGLLVDLSPLWDECFTNSKAYFEEQGVGYKEYITNVDGSCYAIYTVTGVDTNDVILLYNTKWMDELGLEIPTTLDEFNEVARAMKAAGDMNGNGKDDEVVLTGPSVDWFLAGVSSAFGVEYMEDGSPLFSAGDDGVVYDQYTTNNMQAMLAWMNQLYDEDILDRELTTNDMTIVAEKITGDRVGIVSMYAAFSTNWGNLTPGGQEVPYSEQLSIGLPLASEYNGNSPKIMRDVRYSARPTGITVDCENPELAARWLDVLLSDPKALEIRTHGKEGETYYLDEQGVPQIIMPANGETWNINSLGCGQIELPFISTYDQTAFSREYLAPWWGEDYSHHRNDYEWYDPTVPKVPSMTEEEKETYDIYWGDMLASWEEYRDKFITGELDTEADWADFIKTMEALGVKELAANTYQSIYNRTK